MARSSDTLLGALDLLVLKTLARGPNHGFGIALHIQTVSENLLRVEEGSLCTPPCIAWSATNSSKPRGPKPTTAAARASTNSPPPAANV